MFPINNCYSKYEEDWGLDDPAEKGDEDIKNCIS